MVAGNFSTKNLEQSRIICAQSGLALFYLKTSSWFAITDLWRGEWPK